MKYSLTAVVIAGSIIATMAASLQAAVPVVWDGTTGVGGVTPTFHAPVGYSRWEQGNWTRDGGPPGQTATDAMTTVIGTPQEGNRGGRGGLDIVIGGGAKVFHDFNHPDDEPGGLHDFSPRMDLYGAGSLTIKEGATLVMDAHSDNDGRWVRHGINMNLDGGTIRTQHTPVLCGITECSAAGGKYILGNGNETLPNTVLQINMTNGGRMEVDGVLIFGMPDYWQEVDHDNNIQTPPITRDVNPSSGHNLGIGVNMTINNGTLDLTNATAYPQFPFGLIPGDLIIAYEAVGPNILGVPEGPKNEEYNINFTGPGQIIVDNGIFLIRQDSAGVYRTPDQGNGSEDYYTSISYETLWDEGVLQANGLNGLDNPTEDFSDYFSVSGTPGSADYTLTSLVAPPGQNGDHNEDGVVNAADYPAWRKIPADFGGDPGGYNDWRENFGESGPGGGGGVPEPMSLVTVMIGVAGLWFGRRKFVRVR